MDLGRQQINVIYRKKEGAENIPPGIFSAPSLNRFVIFRKGLMKITGNNITG